MAFKNIIADLNKGEKLDGNNYDIWYRKVQISSMSKRFWKPWHGPWMRLKKGSGPQRQRDAEAYVKWAKKDHCAHFVMLSSMHNDLISVFGDYKTAREKWNAMKLKFGETSAMT